MVVIIIGSTALGGPWPPVLEMVVLLNNTENNFTGRKYVASSVGSISMYGPKLIVCYLIHIQSLMKGSKDSHS